MKDFAKSIMTKNADPFGVIYRDGDFKIKYNEKENSYELYFNSIYYDTFHTKQQALDKIELYKRRNEARAGNSKCGNAEVENYDFNEWKDTDGHRWTVRSIENQIEIFRTLIGRNRVNIASLRNAANEGQNWAKQELKREEQAYEANQMKLKQLLSMKSRATGNSEIGNSNKAEIIEKKKKEGATLKVDNGQKLEFSDGSTFVKTSFSDDYREAHNYVGNSLSDSYEFLMSAGKNDYNSIKEAVKKAGGWTPEIKSKAGKTSDALKKKAKELVETAHKQAAELERLAGDIESI